MKPSSFETAIQLQFDTLMKKVIDRLVKDYEKELKRHSKNETLFSELPEIVVDSFPAWDEYELDCTAFNVYGTEIRVSGASLCEALKKLPERKRNNVLMYYFLDMSDTEIAQVQAISRAGVYKNRMAELALLKGLIQEE